jgi:hypothetical protein
MLDTGYWILDAGIEINCKTAKLQNCKTAKLQDCKTAKLQNCKTARLNIIPTLTGPPDSVRSNSGN